MKTASDTNIAEYVTMTSVTRLGYFLKFLATIFLVNIAHLSPSWATLKNITDQ